VDAIFTGRCPALRYIGLAALLTPFNSLPKPLLPLSPSALSPTSPVLRTPSPQERGKGKEIVGKEKGKKFGGDVAH